MARETRSFADLSFASGHAARALCRHEILLVVPRNIAGVLTVTRCFSVNWTLTCDSNRHLRFNFPMVENCWETRRVSNGYSNGRHCVRRADSPRRRRNSEEKRGISLNVIYSRARTESTDKSKSIVTCIGVQIKARRGLKSRVYSRREKPRLAARTVDWEKTRKKEKNPRRTKAKEGDDARATLPTLAYLIYISLNC